jgi:hypothetical protein
MIGRNAFPRWRRAAGAAAVFAIYCLLLWVAAAPPLRAEEPKEAKQGRTAVATSASARGMILRREGGPEAKWLDVAEKESLYTGDLLLGLPGAQLESSSGGVRLQFLTDLGGSPLPVLEAAVILHDTPGFGLDFTLDRGRVDVTNAKKQGAVRVRFRVRDDTWELDLGEPGARVAVEVYGRWPRGVPFTPKPGPKDVPVAELVLFVLKGEVYLKHAGRQYAMHAPPGPAQIGWSSTTGMDASPQRLEKAPPWAAPSPDDPEVVRMKERVAQFVKRRQEKSLGEVLDEMVQSEKALDRRAAVIVMGATDDLVRLGKVLDQAKHIDLWDFAVVTMRHWIGRCPGQDQKLYKALQDVRGLKAGQAAAVVQLLHSFSDHDLAQPETYEMLIDYLASDVQGIRGLANWHLKRLVPAGEKIKFDPLGPKAEREKAREEWKKLIPSGELPPKPKQDKP